MTSKIKSDLQAELNAANDTIAALRDLVGAMGAAAAAVPIAADDEPDWKELVRAHGVLNCIEATANLNDVEGALIARVSRSFAEMLRKRAAEPLKYKPRVAPAGNSQAA